MSLSPGQSDSFFPKFPTFSPRILFWLFSINLRTDFRQQAARTHRPPRHPSLSSLALLSPFFCIQLQFGATSKHQTKAHSLRTPLLDINRCVLTTRLLHGGEYRLLPAVGSQDSRVVGGQVGCVSDVGLFPTTKCLCHVHPLLSTPATAPDQPPCRCSGARLVSDPVVPLLRITLSALLPHCKNHAGG